MLQSAAHGCREGAPWCTRSGSAAAPCRGYQRPAGIPAVWVGLPPAVSQRDLPVFTATAQPCSGLQVSCWEPLWRRMGFSPSSPPHAHLGLGEEADRQKVGKIPLSKGKSSSGSACLPPPQTRSSRAITDSCPRPAPTLVHSRPFNHVVIP